MFADVRLEEQICIAHQRKSDKKNQTVAEHLLLSAKNAKEHALKIGLPLCGELIGLLHDLGKYSAEFQEYIRACIQEEFEENDPDTENIKGKKGKIDHSTAGAQLIRSIEKNHKAFPFLNQILALSIASHHGGLMNNIAPDGTDKYSVRMSKEDGKTHFSEVCGKCPDNILEKAHETLLSDQILNEFMAVLKKIPKKRKDIFLSMLSRFLFSCLLDADRTDTADFEYPENKEIRLNAKYPQWDLFVMALENRLSEFAVENRVDEIRKDVSIACQKAGARKKGIFTLTVPTGGGKTLASLRFALEHARKHMLDRVVYVIPYTSIIDQNAREVQNVFKELSKEYGVELVLEHHSNLTPEKETTAQRLMAENWDAPIVYTTLVQLLDALFKGGTRSARRMHQLAKAVVVFDEIQTLPIKMVHLFNNAMNFLIKVCESSVVLCTATQPLLHNVDKTKGVIELVPDSEIMPDVSALFKELKRVEMIDNRETGGLSDQEIAILIEKELTFTGSVLVIVNTKKSARSLFKLCEGFDAEVYHLSTNQCPQHRLELIDTIRDRAQPDSKTPVICISTQLIEAGVDVDFGSVIRYVAGLDSIAQAAGRCNRSGKRKVKGRVLLVNPAKESIDMLPEIKIGKEKTQRVLDEYDKDSAQFENSLLSPQAIARYFDYYFYGRSSEMEYPVSGDMDDTLLRMLSLNTKAAQNYERRTGESVLLPLKQSFSTAGKFFNVVESQTQGVIVPYGKGKEIIGLLCASRDIINEKELLKQAQRYSVNCYENTLRKLSRVEAIHQIQDSGIWCLLPGHYSYSFGISEEVVYEETDMNSFCI